MTSHNPLSFATRRAVCAELHAAGIALDYTYDRAALIDTLRAVDPNGSHTDRQCDVEGFAPHTVETAWATLAEIVEGAN